MFFPEKVAIEVGEQKSQLCTTAAEKYCHLFNYTKMLLSANIHILITPYKIWKCIFEHGYYIIIIMICFVINIPQWIITPMRGETMFILFIHVDSSVQFSHSVVSDSLRPHELQHAKPPCPSPTPGVHSDSCPSSQ